jgi:probable F420-dependent oxidoreductase
MKIDALVNAAPLATMQELARNFEDAGFDGLVITEGGRTAYLSCTAAALASDLELSTGVAVAFPRSPMVTASIAWELAELTRGKFRLGLGTQVRAHIERRYSSSFDPPGPRLRDYLKAVRAIFAGFRGGGLDYDGEYYQHSLLPDVWSPGPIAVDDPPIDIAAVNPWMLRMAGEWADGVHVHPLNSPTYLAETVVPQVSEGAALSNRTIDDLSLIVPCFTVTGDTEDERVAWREWARFQIGFYGSTPNYAFIFEQLGRGGTTQQLREHQKAGDMVAMAKVIDDELLAHFVVEGGWDEVGPKIVERYDGIASRVVLYFAGTAWGRDRSSLEGFEKIAEAVSTQK